MEASVIIPTYNRADKLRSCLQALCCQTYPAADFEVVVVVDGSTDETLEMLASLETPFTLRVISQPNAGQPSALNRGLVESIGRISIFLDDDILVSPQFVAEHVRLHGQNKLVVGIGQITLTLSSDADWFARGFAQGWNDHYNEFNRVVRQPDWDDCYGGNMSVPRIAATAVGGNTTDLKRGYDIEFAYRLKQYGCSFVYVPQAIGTQSENKGFPELTSDSELAGVGSVELVRRYPLTEATLLGHLTKTPRSWLLAWQLLLQADISQHGIERLRKLAGRRGRTYGWFIFINQYYFWKGVHRAAPERTIWKQLMQFQKRGNLA
jgi:glycosyltransferase involved in cell wall biosynthesis